ncbi:hypothetical protein D049_0291B, partial [Vibrio parahaemolyticus VPTS-2010]
IQHGHLHQEVTSFVIEQVKYFFDQIIPQMRVIELRYRLDGLRQCAVLMLGLQRDQLHRRWPTFHVGS